MRLARVAVLALGVSFAAAVNACKQRVTTSVPVPVTQPTVTDSARGIVRKLGNEPVSVLALQLTSPIFANATVNSSVVALSGALTEQLDHVVGLDVVVSGQLTTQLSYVAAPQGAPIFAVRRFAVRGADGEGAIDGVVNEREGKFFVVMSDGKRADTPFLPTQLRAKVGAWVFLVGPLDRAPTSFGTIAEKP